VIENRYIEGVAIPTYNRQVSRAVKLARGDNDGGGKAMAIAVENVEGQVYRVIQTVGMGAWMRLTSRLFGIGLEDVLASSVDSVGGYDSRFAPTAELRRQVVKNYAAVADDSPSSRDPQIDPASSPAEIAPPLPVAPQTDPVSEVLATAERLRELPETEREAVVLSRVGQGLFRTQLIAYWGGCAVTGAKCISLLKASHIKPWRDCTNEERLDSCNGLLLVPNLDSAFDHGLVTFDAHGRIVLSRQIQGQAAYELHISSRLRIDQKRLTQAHLEYLTYHRAKVFAE
jgi:hypothetical protein